MRYLLSIYIDKSRIAEKGIYTSSPINKGEIIFQYDNIYKYNKVLTKEEINNLNIEQKNIFFKYNYQIDNNLFAGPIEIITEDISIFWNHCCSPNTYFLDENTICALRDINAGEELTYDYCTTESTSFNSEYIIENCNCGSNECRGHVLEDDWKKEEIQKKYNGFFIPYLAKKINNIKKMN
jgi:SET domain-containing protein